jgi:hypothetical protein
LSFDGCEFSLFSENESIGMDPSSLGELTEVGGGKGELLLLQRINFSL